MQNETHHLNQKEWFNSEIIFEERSYISSTIIQWQKIGVNRNSWYSNHEILMQGPLKNNKYGYKKVIGLVKVALWNMRRYK